MTTTSSILLELKKDGFRITPIRKAVISFLVARKCPLSALEIIEKLSSTFSTLNKTTIYRELEFLNTQKIIREIDLGEALKRYEIGSHHHHLICTKCESVTCVDTDALEDSLHKWEHSLLTTTGFTIHEHSLHFKGMCSLCNKLT